MDAAAVWARIRDMIVKTMLAVQDKFITCTETFAGSHDHCFEVSFACRHAMRTLFF